MEETIPQENIQSSDMSPDDAAASLAFATQISEQMMPVATESPEMASQEEVPNQTEEIQLEDDEPDKMAELEDKFATELKGMRKEMKDMMKKEMASLKDLIKEALYEQQDEATEDIE